MGITQKINRSDIIGALVGGLCTIHCALTPIFFAAQPILKTTMEHNHGSAWWAALDYIFLAISLAAVWYSAKHTSHIGFKWGLSLAWAVFAIGLLSEPFHFAYGKWLMYVGSFALIVFHFQNYRHHQMRKKAMIIN